MTDLTLRLKNPAGDSAAASKWSSSFRNNRRKISPLEQHLDEDIGYEEMSVCPKYIVSLSTQLLFTCVTKLMFFCFFLSSVHDGDEEESSENGNVKLKKFLT